MFRRCGLRSLRPASGCGWLATKLAVWTVCAGSIPWGARSCASTRRDFRFADLLDLPGTAEEEADLEGMTVADGFLRRSARMA